MASLMFKITNEEAPDIRTIKQDIPADLAEVLNKAMTKDADARYQRGSEFAQDLAACIK